MTKHILFVQYEKKNAILYSKSVSKKKVMKYNTKSKQRPETQTHKIIYIKFVRYCVTHYTYMQYI